ncbi:MAG: hypothetical protein Q4C77_13250 [Eubacteriales bacterium]|nr:hypothetical protein [Eubacteriales bacterium]
MKITGYEESRERCAESGWFAYDILLEEPLTREDIVLFRPLGGFLFLSMLKQPFFKVEQDSFVIKGVQGNAHFRLAMHQDECEKIEEWIERFRCLGE